MNEGHASQRAALRLQANWGLRAQVRALAALGLWLAAMGCGHSPDRSPKPWASRPGKGEEANADRGVMLQHTRPVPPEAYRAFCKGMTAVTSNHWEQAAADFERVLSIDPEADSVYCHFVRCCDRLGDPDRAVPVLQEWSKRRLGDFRIHAEIGAYLDRWHKRDQAIAEFERSSKCRVTDLDKPDYYLMLRRLASLYRADNNLDGALGCYEKMRATGEAPEAAIEYKIAEAFYEHEQYGQAAEHFEKVLAKKRGFAPALRYLTICYDETQQYERAIQAAETYLGLVKPAAAWPIRSLLADLYERTAQPEKALPLRDEVRATLSRRIGAGSKNLYEHIHLSRLLRTAERVDDAIDVLHKARPLISSKRSPRVAATFHLALAEAYYDNKDDDNVEKELRQVLELDPERHEASNFLGYVYAERGIRLEEAERLVNQALRCEPKNGAYLDSLGWVFYRQAATEEDCQKLHKALHKLLEAAAQLRDPVIRDHIGEVYYALGNWDEAERQWALALDIWKEKPRVPPGPKSVESKLERLRQQRESLKQ